NLRSFYNNFVIQYKIMENSVSEKHQASITQEELLNLIESGDIVQLLSEENMGGFNELMKYELIEVRDDKVFLTTLGKEAKLNGVKETLSKRPVKRQQANISSGLPLKNSRLYFLLSLLLLFFALLMMSYYFL